MVPVGRGGHLQHITTNFACLEQTINITSGTLITIMYISTEWANSKDY